MTYNHPPEKAQQFAQSAFQRLMKEGLVPGPESYELFYVYYAGDNPEVSHALDVLIENDEKITNEHCLELHERFLGDANESEKVKQAGQRIQNTIKEVNGMVSNVKSSTSEYNSKLDDVSDKLSPDMTKEEIELVIGDVKATTQNMVEKNIALEEELNRSSEVMKELQRDLEIVRKEAMTDGLTGLANRKAFDAEIAEMAARSDQEGDPFTLVLLDIDHFKSFNDNYGHLVGDQVLRLVAKTLVDGVKGQDMAARYGGEEFAILLPETDVQGGYFLADKLRMAVESKEVVNRNTGEKLGRITMSGGVAQYSKGEDLESMIERADAALYTAKNNGRNQVSMSNVPGQGQANDAASG